MLQARRSLVRICDGQLLVVLAVFVGRVCVALIVVCVCVCLTVLGVSGHSHPFLGGVPNHPVSWVGWHSPRTNSRYTLMPVTGIRGTEAEVA